MTSRSFRFDNIDKVQQQLRKMPDRALLALKAALVQEAETIRTKSLDLVPTDLHTLKSSIFVDKPPKVKGSVVSIEIGAGGEAEDYAEAVHETPSIHDPPSWKGKTVKFTSGGPKFLSKPTDEAEKGFGKRIGKHVERELKRGL